jgi:hypothetical protein
MSKKTIMIAMQTDLELHHMLQVNVVIKKG